MSKVICFPQQRDRSAELIECVEKYAGNTAEHIDDVLSEVREAIGEALFLHIKPVIVEAMWDFATECKIIGAAAGLKRAYKQDKLQTDKKITPIVCKR